MVPSLNLKMFEIRKMSKKELIDYCLLTGGDANYSDKIKDLREYCFENEGYIYNELTKKWFSPAIANKKLLTMGVKNV